MSEKNNNLEALVKTAIEKIKEMVDVETVIGNPITAPNGTVIIPVSKISVGFASGGSDLPNKNAKDLFGGGTGGGLTIQPLAFITILPDGNVKLLQMTINAPKENAALAMIPDIIDKVTDFISKNKNESGEEAEDTSAE
ncbi:MAG: sporulation protein YtfJ [Oscillospiraceae bacterium]|nr:sporulation protein YtfJ [Oscillospiraceae bacterium]